MKRITVTALIGALIIAAVVIISFYFLNYAEKTPQVHLAQVGRNNDELSGQSTSETSSVHIVAVEPSTVKSILEEIERPDSYYRSFQTMLFWNGGSNHYTIKVWEDSGKVRILSQSRTGEKNILINSDGLYIWYDDISKLYKGSVEELSAQLGDEYQMLSCFEDLLSLDEKKIRDAAYVEYEGEYCIFVQTESELLNYTQNYYISLENALLDGMEIYDGEDLIFKMTASGDLEKGKQPEEVFRLFE